MRTGRSRNGRPEPQRSGPHRPGVGAPPSTRSSRPGCRTAGSSRTVMVTATPLAAVGLPILPPTCARAATTPVPRPVPTRYPVGAAASRPTPPRPLSPTTDAPRRSRKRRTPTPPTRRRPRRPGRPPARATRDRAGGTDSAPVGTEPATVADVVAIDGAPARPVRRARARCDAFQTRTNATRRRYFPGGIAACEAGRVPTASTRRPSAPSPRARHRGRRRPAAVDVRVRRRRRPRPGPSPPTRSERPGCTRRSR